MNKITTACLAGAILVASPLAALAAEGEGVIASIDETTRTITLEDGSTWLAADGLDLTAFMAGDTVSVVYEDGTTVLTEIVKVE